MPVEKKLSYYINESKKLNDSDFEKQIRIAVLGSFTLNGLAETIKVKCAESNVFGHTFSGGYNQYNEEMLDPKSNLYSFSPEICFLVLDIKDILENLFYSPYSISDDERKKFIENKTIELSNLIKFFIDKSKSKLIVTNFVPPTYSPYGIFESKTNYGLQEMIYDLNHKLLQEFKNNPLVYVFDFNGFVTTLGQNNIFDYRQYYFGDVRVSLEKIPYLANAFMSYVKPILGLSRKCIVLDLDNILWGGIIGEDGLNGIKLDHNDPIGKSFIEFQKYLLALHERGIILAVNSKNNFDDAIKVIKEHPNMILHEEHFACLKINWNDKVTNLQEIAQEVNIGLDSMVFFDDDKMNRDFVRSTLPEVLTIEMPEDPSLYVPILIGLNDFNVTKITEEDKQRGKMYLDQRKRTEFQKTTTDFKEYLKQLGIKVTIKNANEFTIPRISQLTLKTNQFNLTTKRYQEEDIRKFVEDQNKIVECAQIQDKFGDNGVTSVYIINKENEQEWFIDTFLLSCRIIGRGVEEALLSQIIKKAKKEGVKKVKAQYIKTKKNKPTENFLSDFGFVRDSNTWIFETDKPMKKLEHMEIS